jgi:pimeloyl-ACP methyl ester carboxylesterase
MSFIDDKSRTVTAGGQNARIYEDGPTGGTPVVVLHGWGGRIESMAPVLKCLVPGHRVVAFDLPGFGESPVPRGVWGTADYAAFVRDALSGIGIERAHFVGHSYGAKTSLYLAATHQDLVDKLVLQGSSGLRTPPSAKARVKRSVSKAARVAGKLGPGGRALRQVVYDRIASTDYKEAGAMRPILVKVVNEDMQPFLGRIKSPTLLIWGTEDDAAPLAHGKTMEKLIPNAGLVEFAGAGHFAYLDEPDRFCTVVRHFLDPK